MRHEGSSFASDGRGDERVMEYSATTSLEDGYGMYGRDIDKEGIMKLLSNDSSDGVLVCVIAIVGMGGVGKTTSTRSVFNNGNLKQMFDLIL